MSEKIWIPDFNRNHLTIIEKDLIMPGFLIAYYYCYIQVRALIEAFYQSPKAIESFFKLHK